MKKDEVKLISAYGGYNMKNTFFYETDIGLIGIAEDEVAITDLFFTKKEVSQNAVMKETQLLKEAERQLLEYFKGKRKLFDLPLAPKGTEFQRSVWKALCEIPYGETRSYSQIAKRIGNEKACRAVGMANNRNPISLIIPCHRVIGADGKLVGYGGGLNIKEYLLKHEEKWSNTTFFK